MSILNRPDSQPPGLPVGDTITAAQLIDLLGGTPAMRERVIEGLLTGDLLRDAPDVVDVLLQIPVHKHMVCGWYTRRMKFGPIVPPVMAWAEGLPVSANYQQSLEILREAGRPA